MSDPRYDSQWNDGGAFGMNGYGEPEPDEYPDFDIGDDWEPADPDDDPAWEDEDDEPLD